jgi:23S rRNA (uracil1939-C5)-methyltransferase
VYAGVGNFTVHLAAMFEQGAAFERDSRAIELLRQNLGAHAPRVRAEACRDTGAAKKLSTMESVDVLVVDPPRAGMKPLLSRFFASTRGLPQRVVMVSCHPMSAVRDIANLVRSAGYEVIRVVPCDLFPQTHHLELVAVLKR